MNETINKIQTFIQRHDVTIPNQMRMLHAEVGELAEADLTRDGLREECADVLFVAQSIALLEHVKALPGDSFGERKSVEQCVDDVILAEGQLQREWLKRDALWNLYLVVKACYTLADNAGFDMDAALDDVATENLGKDTSTKGGKVTKE